MDEKGFNLGLWFGLGFVVMVASSIFATLYGAAEGNPARIVYKILAGLPLVSLGIGFALVCWKKNPAGNYLETSTMRWLSVILVVVAVLLLLFLIVYPGK